MYFIYIYAAFHNSFHILLIHFLSLPHAGLKQSFNLFMNSLSYASLLLLLLLLLPLLLLLLLWPLTATTQLLMSDYKFDRQLDCVCRMMLHYIHNFFFRFSSSFFFAFSFTYLWVLMTFAYSFGRLRVFLWFILAWCKRRDLDKLNF